MNRIVYIAIDSIKNVFRMRNRRINLGIITSIIVGLVIPILALSNFNGFFNDRNLLALKTLENTFVVSGEFDITKENSIASQLKNNNIETTANIYINQALININQDKRFNSKIYGFSESFLIFENFILTDGILPFSTEQKNTAPVVLLEEGFFNENNISYQSPPFEILIDNKSFNVIGIFIAKNYYGNIFMPSETFVNTQFMSKSYISKIYCYANNYIEKGSLNKSFTDIGIQPREIVSAQELKERHMQNGFANAYVVLSISVFCVIFSIINLTVITLGKIVDSQKTISIKLCLGASHIDIFTSLLIENFTIGFLGTSISLCVSKLLIGVSPLFSNSLLDYRVCIIAQFICQAMLFIINVIIFFVFKKKYYSVAERLVVL